MAENEQVVEQEEVQEPQYSPDEQKAMEHGWVPRDQWKGSPDEWIPAKVFNDRGELFGRIARYKGELDQAKQAITQLAEFNRHAIERGYKQALADLKRDKKEALEEGNVERVMEIDDRIEEVREEQAQAKEKFDKQQEVIKTQPVNTDFETWHANNQWYQNDRVLTGFADGLAQEMIQDAQRAGKVPEWPKFYNEITRKVRQKFPEKFETRSRTPKGGDPVEGADNGPSDKPTQRAGVLKESDLNDDERRIMNNILKTTQMTKKEYLEQFSAFEQRKGRR